MIFGGIRIGVLGGIGPESTGEFYLKLISKLQSKGFIKQNADFPQIIVNSIPAPELVSEKISESDLKPYISGLKELDSLRVDVIVMVCNTIHLYYDMLQKLIKTPIIDLRTELKTKLLKEHIGKITILGSPSTVKKLYNFKEIQHIKLDQKDIKKLSMAIFNFNRGISKNTQTRTVEKIAKKYVCKGSQKIVLGCTEFAVMLDKTSLPTINTIDVLVESVMNYFIPKA